MNPRMPSMNDSSEPVETSITRTLCTGSSASARATASSATTPVALSFAPGTTSRLAISANVAAAPAETIPPARRSSALPVSAPIAANAGPPNTGAISAGLVSFASISRGK